MPDLFVYGTLRFPEVLDALLGRVPELSPARAEGWRAAALPGRVYPGLGAAPGTADGLLVGGLGAAELALLHAYEDTEYEVVEIRLTDGRPALAYRWLHEALDEDWDPQWFAEQVLDAYVPGCASWRDEYRVR